MSKPQRKSKTVRRKRRRARGRGPLLALGALILVGLIALGLWWTGGFSSSSSATAVASSAEEQTTPAFHVQDVDGRTVTPASDRPTVLFFMAAWCSSCAAEEQALLRLYREFGDRVQIISVDVDERSDSPVDLKNFRTRFGGPWPHALSVSLALDFRVKALDTTLILDPRGKIVYRDARSTDYATLKRALEKVL